MMHKNAHWKADKGTYLNHQSHMNKLMQFFSIFTPVISLVFHRRHPHMNRLVVLLLFLLLLPGFCFAVPATLEQQHPVHSFLDYSPDPADYPGPLSPLVKLIAEANSLDQDKQKKTAQEKFAGAIELAHQLLDKTPRGYHDSIYQLIGFAEEKSGLLDDAIKSYRTSLELRANNPIILFRHAYLLKRTGNCKEAVPEFQEVVWRTKENTHETLFFLAECLLNMAMKRGA